MKMLSFMVFIVGTIIIAKLLLSSTTLGHWINWINHSNGFASWRVRDHWVGVEREEELWDYICLTVGAIISFPVSVLLYKKGHNGSSVDKRHD